jgi:hypothetical protein
MVKAPGPGPTAVHNSNKQTSKINNKPNTDVKNKPVSTTIRKKKKKEKEKTPKNGNSGGLDEKGNPFPIEDPEGGSDPICPGGYKIDYDFDPFNDPINPPFRCISALKDPSDGPTTNIMNKLNNPSSNVTNMVVNAPAAGGSGITKRMRRRRRLRRYGRHTGSGRLRKITQRRKK